MYISLARALLPQNQETPRELKPQPWVRAMGQRHEQGLPKGRQGHICQMQKSIGVLLNTDPSPS